VNVLLLEQDLTTLFEEVYLRYHYDFRAYARASLRRRVHAAMVRSGARSLADLRAQVLASEDAFSLLVDTLTVRVSDMFRDPEYFAVFRTRILPRLSTYPSIRLWIAGCSSGEEAYSFAVILAEAQLLQRCQIYATDISPAALEQAREGSYPLARSAAFDENYKKSEGLSTLRQHYSVVGQSVVMDPSLRRKILFSDHSLATDHAFGEFQAASCRNVLIYFQRPLQVRALTVLEQSLVHRGYLGLGSRELLPMELQPRFTEFSRTERWYRYG
jgi:chemotaxis protein methyltransferase CheR